MIGFKKDWDFWTILFPKSQTTRFGLHLLFWVLFVFYHMIYFVPLSFEISVTRQTVTAYTLYYVRYMPIFYTCTLSHNLLKKHFFGIGLWLVLILAGIAITHVMTVLVFYAV